MKRRMVTIGLVTAIAVSLLAGVGFWLYDRYGPANPKLANNFKASQVPKWTASTEPLISQHDFEKSFRHYFKEKTAYTAITIPGIRGAWSYDNHKKTAGYGTMWTPQGITQSDEYIFVSSYDGDHKLNSLIAVIDRKTGTYIKSLIMPSQSHVGGIAWDAGGQQLWISNDGKQAKLAAISLATIKAYEPEKIQAPIKLDQDITLPWLKATSTITLSEGVIYVPYFALDADAIVFGLPLVNGTIDTQRLPSQKISNQGNIEENFYQAFQAVGGLDYVTISQGFKKMQGLGISQHLALFTQSYGKADSKVIFANKTVSAESGKSFQIGQSNFTYQGFDFENFYEGEFPPYLEQVDLDDAGNQLLMVFESASSKYRHRTPYIVDRIMVIDMQYQAINDILAEDDDQVSSK